MSDLRFHWMLPKGGEVAAAGTQTPQKAARYRLQSTNLSSPACLPDMRGWALFARRAEESGIDSLLISFSRYEPDPFIVSGALGTATKSLKFIAAYRSGLMPPVTFTQQLETLRSLLSGRVALNVVAGSSSAEQRSYGDHLAHDQRYARAEEYLATCEALWKSALEIYISGHSEQAEHLALTQGSCLLRVADTPEKLRATVARVREHGLEVCLRLCVLARDTHDEAVRVAASLLPDDEVGLWERSTAVKDDSVMYRQGAALTEDAHWLNHSLWTGLVPHFGPVWTTLLGTPAEIAQAILDYKSIGITQFIMSGWPELDSMVDFGRDVLPLVRQSERGAAWH